MITIIHTIDTDGVYDLSPGPGSVAPIREGGDLGDVEVAAGEDGADAGAGEVAGLGGEEGGDAGGAGGFDYELHAFHDEADGGDQVAFGDGDDLIDQLAEQGEGEGAREGGAEAVGDRAGGDRDGFAGGQGGGEGVGGFRFDGDDAAGEGGGVVAGGEGDQAAIAGLLGQGQQAVEGAADLERAGLLERLGLDHNPGPGAPVEGGRGHHRGPVDPSGDPSRCRPYRRCVHPAPPCAVLVRPCRQTRLSDPTGCYGPAPVPGRGGSGRGPRRRRARPAR